MIEQETQINTPNHNPSLISLDEFRAINERNSQERRKALVRAEKMLAAMLGISRDYEAHMFSLANERPREDWVVETGQDPYEQIAFDVNRLWDFHGALQYALQEKDAVTLGDALVEMEEFASEEVLATVDYLFNSEYFGFLSLRDLFNVGEMNEGRYEENADLLESIEEDLSDGNYVFSILPLRELLSAEVLAS